MSTLFNVTNTGNFTDDLTFTRPMSTAQAVYTAGTELVTVPIVINLPASLVTESVPIRGIFLQIGEVDRNATGTFTISLKTSLISFSFTYQVSALYKEYNKGQGFTTSQYWQGFDLLDTDLSWINACNVEFSCSSPGELKLVGNKKTNNYNRYFIPATVTDFLSASLTPDIKIGSYMSPIAARNEIIPTSITCDRVFTANTVVLWNQSTLTLSGSAQLTTNSGAGGAGVLVSPGSTLFAYPSSTFVLRSGSIIGLNSSHICLSGTEKQPFTHLVSDQLSGQSLFNTTSDISGWQIGDTVLMTGNSALNSSEIFSITAVPTDHSFSIKNVSKKLHYGIDTIDAAAPIVNLTRDVDIKATSAAIRAEDSCKLELYNVQLSGMGVPTNTKLRAAVNLFNTDTTINKCAIHLNTAAAVYADTSEAVNFNLNSNGICNNGYGIYAENRLLVANPLLASSFKLNAVINNSRGIAANYINNTVINDNIISHSTNNGLIINGDILPTIADCNVKQISGNKLFANNFGCYIKNVNGSVDQTISKFNRGNGMYLASINQSIAANVAICTNNSQAGMYVDGLSTIGSNILINSISAIDNLNKGVVLNCAYGSISSVYITGNTEQSLVVNNCNQGILNLYKFNIFNNDKSVTFSYPNLSGFNFYPTYLIDSYIDTAVSEPTCITLNNTKCEKFIVENTKFSSTGPNITLAPSDISLIEGSYIFGDCTFTSPPFDDISTKYQTDVFGETGFVSMYEEGSAGRYYKYTSAGLIQSDTTVFKNTNFGISEKLTPSSDIIKLRSSKKTVYIDNFDSSVPPNLQPEYLFVSVWVKKDNNWGLNANPRLIVANNPTLHINQDTIIDVHNLATTNWVQLTSIAPVAVAEDTRGTVELYVDCSGTSGGSINVDQWECRTTRSI